MVNAFLGKSAIDQSETRHRSRGALFRAGQHPGEQNLAARVRSARTLGFVRGRVSGSLGAGSSSSGTVVGRSSAPSHPNNPARCRTCADKGRTLGFGRRRVLGSVGVPTWSRPHPVPRPARHAAGASGPWHWPAHLARIVGSPRLTGEGARATPAPSRRIVPPMKAVAVLPGKPNSVHLRDIPVPKLTDQPHPHVCRDPRGPGRAGQGAPGRRRRHRPRDQRGPLRQRPAGRRAPRHRPRELRPGRRGRRQGDRGQARRLRLLHRPPARRLAVRRDRPERHHQRGGLLRARDQPLPRLPDRVVRRRRRVHRQGAAEPQAPRRPVRAGERLRQGDRAGVPGPAAAPGLEAEAGVRAGRRPDRPARHDDAPAPRHGGLHPGHQARARIASRRSSRPTARPTSAPSRRRWPTWPSRSASPT